LDLYLTKSEWKNIVKNVETKAQYAFNSDHPPVIAEIAIKLRNRKRDQKIPIQRYRKPTGRQSIDYNTAVSRHYDRWRHTAPATTTLAWAITQAAEECLTPIDEKQNTEYISSETWTLIKERETARIRGDVEEEQRLNKAIKKAARQDKKQWRIQKLEEWSDPRSNWKHLKREKAEFKPNFYGMKDLEGNRVPLNKKAEALAEYLSKQQWGTRTDAIPIDPDRPKIITRDLHMNTGDISIEEVTRAKDRLKKNKAPGPDGIVAELYSWLENDGLNSLHHALAQNWRNKSLSQYENSANIACLYKKGDHENPENYRPISLLNVTYKLMAYIIQERISEKLDDFLGNLQSGFRKGRSTIDPIFCVRRIQDIAEHGHDRLIMIMLD